MFEIDFLPVGEGQRSGDAIAVRFTRRDTGALAVAIMDAGFEPTGEALVDFVKYRYDTDIVDLAILTHPDADHIGGMGKVVRGLTVRQLWVHDIGNRGGSSLRAARAVWDLISLTRQRGGDVYEVWPGAEFAGVVRVLGPSESYYNSLVADQVAEAASGGAARKGASPVLVAARTFGSKVLNWLPFMPPEIPFDDKGGTSPRNNTSIITHWDLGDFTALLCGDAGVPALDAAWDWLEASALEATAPNLIQVAHHGSRHNCSTQLLDRILAGGGGNAYISVAADSPDHPSPRVLNAYARRGYGWQQTAGQAICRASPDAPARPDYGPLPENGPLDESTED